ncbi:MAG: hypothetical protein ACREEW_10370, partial [Caulobacteraceae bacterium]
RLSVDAPHLAAADLVILVRELHRFWDEGVVRFLEAAGVPYVYFTDDNFLALRAERSASRFYSARRVTRALAGAAEVWASTPALAVALKGLHPRVRVWSPVLDPVLAGEHPAPPSDGGRVTVAVAAEDFRLPGLRGAVLERLRDVAAGPGLRLVLTPAGARALALELPDAEIVAMPRERSFRQFVRQWRRFGVDILLHPAGATANAPFKCPTSAIVAGYLGAAPVAADEPAYADWGEEQGVVALGAEAEGLALAAARARDPDWRGAMQARLRNALASRLGEAGRLEALAMLLDSAPSARRRIESGAPGLVLGRAGLAIAKATRRLRDAAIRPG